MASNKGSYDYWVLKHRTDEYLATDGTLQKRMLAARYRTREEAEDNQCYDDDFKIVGVRGAKSTAANCQNRSNGYVIFDKKNKFFGFHVLGTEFGADWFETIEDAAVLDFGIATTLAESFEMANHGCAVFNVADAPAAKPPCDFWVLKYRPTGKYIGMDGRAVAELTFAERFRYRVDAETDRDCVYDTDYKVVGVRKVTRG